MAILDERGHSEQFNSDEGNLRLEVKNIQKQIELERFEKHLLEDADVLTLSDLDSASGGEFEVILAELFSKMGFEVEQTRLTGDQGADLVVVKFGEKTVVQAKCYTGNVGNYAVQEIVAACGLYGAQKGMVVTNSYFTPSAAELAKANRVELVDRTGLEALIRKYW